MDERHCKTCACGCTCGFGGEHVEGNPRCALTAKRPTMTARETTLGALTAADLGSVILLDGCEVGVAGVLHNEGGTVIFLDVPSWNLKLMPSTTPVTVYEKEEA